MTREDFVKVRFVVEWKTFDSIPLDMRQGETPAESKGVHAEIAPVHDTDLRDLSGWSLRHPDLYLVATCSLVAWNAPRIACAETANRARSRRQVDRFWAGATLVRAGVQTCTLRPARGREENARRGQELKHPPRSSSE